MSVDGKVGARKHRVNLIDGKIDGADAKNVKGARRDGQMGKPTATSRLDSSLFSDHLLRETQKFPLKGLAPIQESVTPDSMIKGQKAGMSLPRRNPGTSSPRRGDASSISQDSFNSRESIKERIPSSLPSKSIRPSGKASSQNIGNRKNRISDNNHSQDSIESSKKDATKVNETGVKSDQADFNKRSLAEKSISSKASQDSSEPENSEVVAENSRFSKEALDGTQAILRSAIGDLAKTPVLSLLTGRLDQLEPQSIVDIVASNGFIQGVLTETSVDQFLQKELYLGKFLIELEVSSQTMMNLEAAGINFGVLGTPEDFLKSMGVDTQQLKAEIEVLKDNLSLGALQGYLFRSKSLNKVQQQTDEIRTGDLPESIGAFRDSPNEAKNNEKKIKNVGSQNEDPMGPNVMNATGESVNALAALYAAPGMQPHVSDKKNKPEIFLNKNNNSFSRNVLGEKSFSGSKSVVYQIENSADGGEGMSVIPLGVNENGVSQGDMLNRAKNSSEDLFPAMSSKITDELIGSDNFKPVGNKATFDHWFQDSKLREIERFPLKEDNVTYIGQSDLEGEQATYAMFEANLINQDLEDRVLSSSSQFEGLSRGPELDRKVKTDFPIIHENSYYLGDPHINDYVGKNKSFAIADDKVSATVFNLDGHIEMGGIIASGLKTADSELTVRSEIRTIEEDFLPKDSGNEFVWKENSVPDRGGAIRFSQTTHQEGFSGDKQEQFPSKESSFLSSNSLTSQERTMLVQKIFDSAQILATQGGGQIQFQMPQTPWGKIDISIQMIENQLNIRIGGVEDSLKDNLIDEFGSLTEALESRKIEIGRIEFIKPSISQKFPEYYENFGGRSQQNLDDHVAHREWMNELKSQVKFSARNLNNVYKSS